MRMAYLRSVRRADARKSKENKRTRETEREREKEMQKGRKRKKKKKEKKFAHRSSLRVSRNNFTTWSRLSLPSP